MPMLGIGTFADHAVVDERSLVKVQTDLPDEQLALIGCGVTTGVGAVLNTAAVCPGSSVAVLGCGGVGQSVVQGARIAGGDADRRGRPRGAQARDRAGARRHRRGRSRRRRPGRGGPRADRRARRRLRVRGRRRAGDADRGLRAHAARRDAGHGRHPDGGRVLLDAVRRRPQREARARLLVRIGRGAPRLPAPDRARRERAGSTSRRWSRGASRSTTSTTDWRRSSAARSSAA